MHAAPASIDVQPIPFTLTAKAHATLAVITCGCGYDDCPACADYEWVCLACGLAFFGTAPDDGLCAGCRPGGVSQ